VAGEILRIPSDDCICSVFFRLPEKHRVAERHFLGDIGSHVHDKNAPPRFGIMGPQPVKIYDRNGVDGDELSSWLFGFGDRKNPVGVSTLSRVRRRKGYI